MKASRKIIPAGKFKAQCLGLLEQVSKNKEIIVVTKRGRQVAKVVPVDEDKHLPLLRSIRYHGDIVKPTGAKWNADR